MKKNLPTTVDNTLQKTNVQTLQASFATETLAAHCGQKGGNQDDRNIKKSKRN